MDDRTVKFSYEELTMLSEGILAVMENTKKAKALTTNSEVHEILSRDMEAYRELGNKIYGMMVEPVERG